MYMPFAETFASDTNRTVAQPDQLLFTRLFGLNLLRDTRANAADMLIRRAQYRVRTQVAFINAHCVNTAASNEAYRAALHQADLLLPDGSGVKLAARMAREPVGDNLNGTDLFPELCERAAAKGLPIFLLGGQPGVAQAAADAMAARYPGLIVAGTRDGYFKPGENDDVVRQINASGAAMVFVGMGVPVQELWIARNFAAIECPVVLGVGGLFDYFSGRISRAPLLFRKVGCEWVWRLIQEPRRLAQRYLIGNFTFMARAWLHADQDHIGGWINSTRKRAIDVAVSALALLLLAPIFALVALAIRAESRGPVFFRQTRIGENGRPFTMWKFRSMVVDAHELRKAMAEQNERDSICFKIRRDPRVTRVGAFIRRASIDELPQLFNVLAGDMSLVGPRPALPEEVAQYLGNAWRRLQGKPGITCIWQTAGRATIPFEQQVHMDIAYLRASTMKQDLHLLGRTIPAVLLARGAF